MCLADNSGQRVNICSNKELNNRFAKEHPQYPSLRIALMLWVSAASCHLQLLDRLLRSVAYSQGGMIWVTVSSCCACCTIFKATRNTLHISLASLEAHKLGVIGLSNISQLCNGLQNTSALARFVHAWSI